MKIKEWTKDLDINLILICFTASACLIYVMHKLTSVDIAKYKAQTPTIQHVGVPVYFTNFVHSIVIVPTNAIPLTNVVTATTPKSN